MYSVYVLEWVVHYKQIHVGPLGFDWSECSYAGLVEVTYM